MIIDGKKEAASLRQKLKDEVTELKKKFNNVPGLTVILIGELAPSQIYVRNKEKSAKEVGLNSEVIRYPNDVDEKTIIQKIKDKAKSMLSKSKSKGTSTKSTGQKKGDIDYYKRQFTGEGFADKLTKKMKKHKGTKVKKESTT